MADRRDLEVVTSTGHEDLLLVNGNYVFDPVLLDWVLRGAGRMLDQDGVPVLVWTTSRDAQPFLHAMETDTRVTSTDAAKLQRRGVNSPLFFRELFKVEPPFVIRLNSANAREAERLSYAAAYRGVTDLLTKYAWKGLAFQIVRLCAGLGLTPNVVTSIGLAFCLAAAALFYNGAFAAGLFCALAFMVLDTVDGKLARCTIQSSRFGDLFDHVTDVLHPPLWWWAWCQGLATAQMDFVASDVLASALHVTIAGYAGQRLVELAFIFRLKMQIHLWRPFDSRFKLISAQRNIHVLILAACYAVSAPDVGMIVVAIWTVASLTIHSTRLAQAMRLLRRSGPVVSWLTQAAPAGIGGHESSAASAIVSESFSAPHSEGMCSSRIR
jgi:phosphatidylglycerophosphate synthase